MSVDTQEGAYTPGKGNVDALVEKTTTSLIAGGASDPSLTIADDGSVGITAQFSSDTAVGALTIACLAVSNSLGVGPELIAYAEVYSD